MMGGRIVAILGIFRLLGFNPGRVQTLGPEPGSLGASNVQLLVSELELFLGFC